MAYPPPQSGAPTSYKTDVNRAKTKRWAEAKSCSYDGDDWGDADEFDEYNDPPAPAPPKPTGLRQRGQSATHPTQVPNESYQGPSHGVRHEFDDTAGTAHIKAPHGVRSVTNPQPQRNSTMARSNSFDRGDERRVFSGPSLQQNPSNPVELAQQSGFSQQGPVQALSHQEPNQRAAILQTSNQPAPSQNPSYGGLPNQEGLPPPSSSSYLFAGKEQVQPPIDVQAKQQVATRSEPGRQQMRAQSHLDPDQHPQRNQQTNLPFGNYRVGPRPDQASQQSFGSKTHSMDSNNSSPAFENRHDFSQLGSQPQSQTGGPPSPHHSSESISSSSFPPRKSSLTQGLPNLPQAPTGVTLGSSGGESHPLRDRTGNTDSEKTPMFVRPAEIYKRMQEEQERDRRSQDSLTPKLNTKITNTTDSSIPSAYRSDTGHANTGMNEGRISASEASRNLSQSVEPFSNRDTAPAQGNNDGIEKYPVDNRRPNAERIRAEAGFDNTLRPVLPDVTRMSSFGDIFTSTTSNTDGFSNSSFQGPVDLPSHITPPGQSQDTVQRALQRQQSLGLRSVVHQAFDTSEDQIPATPSSMAGSGVARSTSGGTSVISPIISRGPSISRAIPNIEKEASRPSDPQAELDDTPVDKSTPISSSRLTTPQQMPGIISPSQPSALNEGDILPPNFIPGHRRDTSTPSPNNSPARTPALESSKLAQPLLEAELAVVTPTERTHFEKPDSHIRDSTLRNDSATNLTRSGDTATGRQPVDWKPLNLEARLPKLYVPPVIGTNTKRQDDSISGSPITPLKDPSNSRPDSPSKNRVRDLAGKFESNSSSRRGSNHSISQSNALLSSGGQKADDASPTRPVVDRLESFRPRLPGAWESFSSNAPKRASMNQIEKEVAPREVISSHTPESSTDVSPPPGSAPLETQSKTAREDKDVSFIVKAEKATQDSFAAAAAAGAALAGALTAAVGINQEASRAEPVDGASSDGNKAGNQTEVMEGMKRGRNLSVDTVLHPEASRPPRPQSTGGDLSSEPPTLPSKDLPQSTDYVQNDSRHHMPAVSAGDSEESNVPAVETIWNSKNQAMLPPLSTDIRNHQYESDRLRREIVKNLSPQGASEPTTAESESPWQDNSRLSADPDVQAYGRDSMVIPKEYESYWNGSNSGGGVSPSNSHLSQPQSASSPNQARDSHITPPKPLQLARATQPGNVSTEEYAFDASKRPAMEVHQYSGEKELVETSLPAHQPLDRQINDISPPVLGDVQGMSELPAAPYLPDILTQPHHTTDQNYHPPDGDQRAGIKPTLLASDHTFYRARTETEDLPQSYGVTSEPVNPGLHGLIPSPGRSWAHEQSISHVPPSYLGHIGSPPSYATGATHIENPDSNPPIHYQARSESLSKSATTSVPIDKDYDLPSPPLPPSAQPKIRAFREIMALKSPEERIRAYDEAREQIANQNTGLAHWLAVKSRELPEHASIFSGSQRPLAGDIGHKPSPSRSKLSGLRPAGGQPAPQPYYQQYLGASQHNMSSEAAGVSNASGSGGSQGFSPGGAGGKTSHNVQTKTKDFLHSAGLFGAKGLFSKGKSKLRGSGGVDKVSSSIPNSDLISRGMQPQSEPPAGLQPEIDSINLSYPQQYPKQRLVSEQAPLSRPHIGPPSSVQDHNLGKAQRPPQSQYFNGGEQNDTQISQGLSHAQNKSSPLVSRPPTSSTLGGEGHLSQQTTAQNIARGELQHSGTIAITDPRVSRATPTEAPYFNSEHSAANLNVPIREKFNSSGPDRSAANLVPLEERAVSQLKPALNAPRLPYPDVGGLFHKGWDDQREPAASQVANSQHPQSQPIPEYSNSMFHDRVDLEQPWSISQRGNNLERSHESQSRPIESYMDEPSPDQGALPTAKPFFLTEDHAQNPKQRPFSFMELASDKTQKPVQEILQHVRSDEANPSGNQYERDPSPVSPQRSLHDPRNQYSQEIPTQGYTSDDFLPSEKQLELATQSPSFHFQDPNLHEHPAFRHEALSADDSSLRAEHVPAEAPRRISGVQHQRLPPAVPPHGVITNSWRNPSDSRFLPTLSAPKKAEEAIPITESGYEDSHFKAPVSPETKTRRASLFRSFNGRNGKDRDSGRDARETTVSPLATHFEPKTMSSHHENTKIDTRTSESSKARNKLQRASTSAVPVPEQDSGKKKRFSALGSLFGRSNQDKAKPKTQVVHSNPLIQHPTFVSQPPAFDSRDVHSTSIQQQQQQQQQGYHFAPQDYYAQPPQGGYYAPGQQFDDVPNKTRQPTRQAYPRAPDSPAYMQDTALRQGNMVHSHRISSAGKTSPTMTTPLSGLRQSTPRGDSMGSRYSSIPAPRRQDIHNSSSIDSGWTVRAENSPLRTGQSVSASQLRSEFFSNTPRHEPHRPQHSQHQPTYSPHDARQASQDPPPPPPKHDQRSDPGHPSLTPNPSSHYDPQQASPSPSLRFQLPPIQTSVAAAPSGAKTPQEKAEMRKSRQMEIEHGTGRAESNGGTAAGVLIGGVGVHPVERNEGASDKLLVKMEGGRRDSSDSDVVMSSTSYPGMEWQPREFSRWDGN